MSEDEQLAWALQQSLDEQRNVKQSTPKYYKINYLY